MTTQTETSQGSVSVDPDARWVGEPAAIADAEGLLQRNFAILGAALRHAKLDELIIEYAGQGDDGGVEGLTGYVNVGPDRLKKPLEDLPDCRILSVTSGYDTTTCKHVAKLEEMEMSFEDAAEAVLDDALEANGLAGYEDGNGAEGSLTIWADGRGQLSHGAYVVTQVTTDYPYKALVPAEAAPVAPEPASVQRQVEPLASQYPANY